MSETITIDEMRALIKEEKIKPNRLFGIEALAEDPVVKGITKEAIQTELVHRKRLSTRFEEVDEDREKDKVGWEKEKKKLEDAIKVLKIEGTKIKAADLFSAKAKERKLDDKQIKFIEARRDNFMPEDLDNTDKEVDKFMDNALDDYKKTAEIFGQKVEIKKEKDETGGTGAGSEEDGEDTSYIPDSD